MITHTPGPWTLHEYHGHVTLKGQCGHDAIINTMGHSCSNPDLYDEEQANARLVAAAPELLEALKRVMDALAYEGVDEDFEAQYAEGEAAIAKAEGA